MPPDAGRPAGHLTESYFRAGQAISSLPDADTRRVQPLPVADEFGTAQLPPAAPSAWPVRSAGGLGAPISRGCPPPRQRGGPPTTPPGTAPSPYHQWAGECAQRSRAETVMRVRRGRSWLTAASRQPGTAGGPGVCARRHAHGPVGQGFAFSSSPSETRPGSRARPSLASFPPPGRKAHARAAFPWRSAGPPLAPPTGTIGLCGRRQPLGDAREIPLLTIVPAGRVRLWERYGSGHPPACRIVWLSSHLDELTCHRHHALADPCYVSPFERAWRSAPWRPSASLLHTCALVMA